MGGQKDMMKLVVAFRNFTNEPKNYNNSVIPLQQNTTFTHFTSLINVSAANESTFYKRTNISVCIWFSEISVMEDQ